MSVELLMPKLCERCGGTGMFLGNGMILTKCVLCSEVHEENMTEKEKKIIPLNKIDRRSRSYQKAIMEIMKTNAGMSRAEATEMFNKAYEKN